MTATDYWEIVAVCVLIVIAGLLAACETSISRIGRLRAYHLRDEGERGAAALVKIAESPAPFLNVILLLTLLAQLGGTTLAGVLATRFLPGTGEVIATLAMTVLLFVFAEVTPKTFTIQHTDRVALRLAPTIVGVTRAIGPLARGLIGVANVILPGKGLPQGPFATEEDIMAMAEVASQEESIEEGEKELIHSIFEFGDTLVREVMVPRPDISAAPLDSTVDQVLDIVLRRGYSRIPVYRGALDDVVGIAYAKDMLRHLHAGRAGAPLEKILRPAYFVPETKKVADLLKEMQQRRVHIAIALDEYGSVAGLVTIEDVLEEIVGEIVDEYDREEPQVVPVGGDSYRVTGRLPIDDLSELLETELPHDGWDTVGGLVYGLLGEVPTQGQRVDFGDLTFTADQVQGRRIAKVLVTRRATEDEGASSGSGQSDGG